jgi:hypothetical protein
MIIFKLTSRFDSFLWTFDDPAPPISKSWLRPCIQRRDSTEAMFRYQSFGHQIYYAEVIFSVTSECRYIYEVLNIDEIKT